MLGNTASPGTKGFTYYPSGDRYISFKKNN